MSSDGAGLIAIGPNSCMLTAITLLISLVGAACLLDDLREKDDHEDDPNWAPRGWKRIADGWVPEALS